MRLWAPSPGIVVVIGAASSELLAWPQAPNAGRKPQVTLGCWQGILRVVSVGALVFLACSLRA